MTSTAMEMLLWGPIFGKVPIIRNGFGVPNRILRFTWMDGAAVVVVLLTFTVSLIAVLHKPAAVFFG